MTPVRSGDDTDGFQQRLPLSSPGLTGRSSNHQRRRNKHWSHLVVYIPALHSHHRLLGRPVKPGDDTGDVVARTPPRPHCAISARVDVKSFASKQRARETPGARCTRSLACENKKARRVSHYRFTGTPRRFPRNGFNGFLRALPSDRALLPLSFVDRLTSLTPASGRQDHTTSPSAASIVRLSMPLRPPHPIPRS